MKRNACGFGLGLLLVLVCAVLVLTGGVAAAKSKTAPGVRAEDFSSHGIALGQEVSERQLTKAFGKLLYDDDLTRWSVPLRRYTFKNDVRVFAQRQTNRVVEIVLEKQAVRARGGVRYGATSYYVQKIYGKAERVNLDGAACFIYTNAEEATQRLICTVDHDDGSLTELRLTTLPLTEEEANDWAARGLLRNEDDAEGDATDILIENAAIDTSALPESGDDVPRLGGLLP